jgi:hypothetical protein
MHALVPAQVQPLDRRPRYRPRRLLAHQGEDRPVVMPVAVHVEHVPTRGRGDGIHDVRAGALADVDHAFEVARG